MTTSRALGASSRRLEEGTILIVNVEDHCTALGAREAEIIIADARRFGIRVIVAMQAASEGGGASARHRRVWRRGLA